MTKKYICNECGDPCILEVKKDSSAPFTCPYHETNPEWELMQEEIPEFTFRGITFSGTVVYGNLSELRYKYRGVGAGTYISNSRGMPYAYKVIPESVKRIQGGD